MIQKILFSIPSICLHTLWFVGWYPLTMGRYHMPLDRSTFFFTLILSIEAIYICLFIGLEQQTHAKNHQKLKEDVVTLLHRTKRK